MKRKYLNSCRRMNTDNSDISTQNDNFWCPSISNSSLKEIIDTSSKQKYGSCELVYTDKYGITKKKDEHILKKLFAYENETISDNMDQPEL
jgi:hypothetical protein